MFFEIIGLLFVFAIILLLCYYTTRFVGKRFSGEIKNRSMKIIETLPLGLDRSLYLILVGKKTFLFFSSKKGLELVSEIEIEELAQEASLGKTESTNIFDFRKIFETYSGLSQKEPLNHSKEKDGDLEAPQADGINGSSHVMRSDRSHSANGSSHVVQSERSHSANGSSHVVRSERSHSILGSIKRLQKINGSKK